MKYYAPENAHFLLPFQFDPTLLENDLKKCSTFNFLKNYVPANYNGDNYILPLRSIDGRLDLPAAFPNSSEKFKNTTALEKCPYFKEVIDSLLCEKDAIRLMNLPSGRVINEHVDYNCGYEDGLFRVHIPIITNDQVRFTLNGIPLTMRPGEAWYTNVNLPHSVTNTGSTNRVHLVLDCIRNEWSDKLFGSVGFDFTQEKEVAEQFTESTKKRMIEELELQGTPASKKLIIQLKQGTS